MRSDRLKFLRALADMIAGLLLNSTVAAGAPLAALGVAMVPADHFPTALEFTLQNEGDFVNHPADRGGPTKFGVTALTLTRWRLREAMEPTSWPRSKPPPLCTAEEVCALTIDEARDIYRAFYWDAAGLGRVANPAIATALFDACAWFGAGAAVRAAQAAAGVTVDGLVGPVTAGALNAVDTAAFVAAFQRALMQRAEAIVKSTPGQAVFLAGWRARIGRYAVLVA